MIINRLAESTVSTLGNLQSETKCTSVICRISVNFNKIPLSRRSGRSLDEIFSYGLEPNVKISHKVTPYAQTTFHKFHIDF